ncbi:MAG: accessory Sec system glycosyltransferase GtfA [Kandleria vitulina]|jgi:accessory Sec system glycosylation protein GtfA|uniref:accessory Sec system glycosyltransferase GtfA n=1 Tax=Kandleria vitulina TaxID=1630 RepID=UPI002E75A06C|nr:accessory Sec system glycosyltransferase GtfA [Kandleria vitulina]MEE0988965.1 accessory Sec system glycosyltransferase GtfA [Kandleria vitulina]
MSIYNINLGIGWASSGVEYAQAYRAKVLRELGFKAKFIFMDMFQYENIEHMTKNIGFQDDEIIWLYQYFTDMPIEPTTMSEERFEKTFTLPFEKKEDGNKIIYSFPNNSYMCAYLTRDHRYIHRVECVSDGCLIRKDFFTSQRAFTEYYVPHDNKANLYRRCFYNRDGSIGLDEYINGDDSIYRVNEHFFYNKEDFIGYFLKQLHFTKDDVVIEDRNTGMESAIFKAIGDAKLGVVIHAEHYNKESTDEHNILWNNYYEYSFNHHKDVSFFLSSTKRQEETLRAQFKKYYDATPRIETIPVGSLKELKVGERKPYHLMTASRLATEKNIDHLIHAVVKAHEKIPQLVFDIYGQGGEKDRLTKLITDYNANSYIRLKGHQNLDEVFKQYDCYISASGSEGFGLTLLEAVGSGCALIGYDVPYGNQTFIKNNGYLVDYDAYDTHACISSLSEAIVKYYEEDHPDFHQASYDIAKEYLDEEIAKKWKNLLEDQL